MNAKDLKFRRLMQECASWGVFIVSAVVYLLTLDHSASYWDCPEYVTCASRLEVGHPPGNPLWMLAMRMATLAFPNHLHAVVINACSALFMAFAAFFLSRITFILGMYTIRNFTAIEHKFNWRTRSVVCGCAAFAAGASFAFTDSAWFSAVEAEVYAMSAFLTSLSVWLMLVWASTRSAGKRCRLLVLVAYITGLSLGVHQLNLLCIPVFALIFIFSRNPRHATLKAWGAILLSFVIVALVLLGMMQGALTWAMDLELTAVNRLGLPVFSGVLIYLILLIVMMPLSAAASERASRPTAAIATTVSIWLSGLFVFGGNLLPAAVLSAMTAAVLVFVVRMSRRALATLNWMTTFLLLGYSSFALIIIRGAAAPPMNEGAPTDIFALSSYIARDQYGSKPLFYGATPYSKPMLLEEHRDGAPSYTRYALKKTGITYVPSLPEARLHHRSGMMTHDDSITNKAIMDSPRQGYILSDYTFKRITTPELDMWLPRITSSSPYDLQSYSDWVGMDKESMKEVRISEAFDSLGNPVGKLLPDGSREESVSYRPTYLQNLQMFLSYQVYYMYFRYLLWNLVGRQNDMHSTGEIEHGNFISGIPLVDNAMLGDQSLLPDYAGKGNPGRHVYFGIPFLLGVAGIVWLFRKGQPGRRTMAMVTLMFLMTGLAIVVYLNQAPGEARERDYSFLGSYMAFCIWIGFGALWLCQTLMSLRIPRSAKILLTTASSLLSPAVLLAVNYGDHQRTGRSEPLDFASDILRMERPSIIFTHGDNDTFPLWYAQETEGIGRRHTVIDISYLAVPGYVVNIMRQGNVRFTATPSDIAYSAYAFTRIANDADTVPTPLIDILKELYASREGTPTLRHTRATIPGNNGDTLTVNLRSIANGGSLLTFRTLLLLDMIASGAEGGEPVPMHFLFPVKPDFYAAVAPAIRDGVFSHVYDPATPDSLWMREYESMLRPTLDRLATDSTSPYYRDPVILDRTRRQRGALVLAASQLTDSGKTAEAAKVISLIASRYPYGEIQAGSFTVADSTFHEGIEFGRLLLKLHRLTGDSSFRDKAAAHSRLILSQAQDWERYYRSLSPRQKRTVSSSTLRIIGSIPKIKKLSEEL